MKIVTLNLWGGRLTKEILEFISKYNGIVDVFCFQEVFNGAKVFFKSWDKNPKDGNPELLRDIQEVLTDDYHCVFDPVQSNEQGVATFVREKYAVRGVRSDVIVNGRNTCVPGKHETIGRTILSVELFHEGHVLWVSQFHGLWNGQGKDDCPERFRMIDAVRNHLRGLQGSRLGKENHQVLCGDFNLTPKTEAMTLLRVFPLVDHVRENGIKTTRTSHYERRETSPFADYIMTSPKLPVKSFEVLPDECSDHAALLLEI